LVRIDQELFTKFADRPPEAGSGGQGFAPHPHIILFAIGQACEIRGEVVDQHRSIFACLLPIEARLIPVARLGAEEDADHHD
jgi:hypothetical protein